MEELSRLFKKARETKVELPPKVTLLNENGPMMLETGPKFDITKTGAHTTKTETHTTTGTRSRRTKFKRSMIHQADPRASRTVFIGNLPLSASKKDVLKLVLPYGAVESLRQRSVAIAPGKLPVNIARKVQKQQTGSTSNFYVVMATEGGASACLELNGRLVDGRHIRVDLATPTKDVEHSVFVGNLPFNADEESVRELFQ
jgi:nucleolar protein 12